MPARETPFDVAVVGASIAGCTAARLFALAGARVALIERRPDPGAYKVVCTHAILSSAVPTIERVGLAPLLEARGALRTHPEAWTPYGGWIRFPTDAPYGYGVTRWTLDPILRELAAETPGVELLPGRSAVRLLGDDGRPAGVEVERPSGEVQALRARLVVGADGRDSTVARLARVPGPPRSRALADRRSVNRAQAASERTSGVPGRSRRPTHRASARRSRDSAALLAAHARPASDGAGTAATQVRFICFNGATRERRWSELTDRHFGTLEVSGR